MTPTSQTEHRTVLVGPLPPPVDGRAVATEWLSAALQAAGVHLDIYDTQLPESRIRPMRKALRALIAAAVISGTTRGPLILVASGQYGLLLELPALAANRLRRRRTYIMHHVSSYVRSTWWPMRIALRIAGNSAKHVLLCDPMRIEFLDRYGLRNSGAHVLDNAALVPDYSADVPRTRSIAHIANLSIAKGTLTAMRVAEAVGAPLTIAGPADTEVAQFLSRLSPESAICHIPFVGYTEKRRLLSSARVFLFPTTYSLEAQPLVIYEAVSAGAIPIAYDQGWIRDQMTALGLERYVFNTGDAAGLIRATRELLTMPAREFDQLSSTAQQALAALRRDTQNAVHEFAYELTRPAGPRLAARSS